MDNVDKTIMSHLEGENVELFNHILEIKQTLAKIETKVDIHNNYERRLDKIDDDVDTLKKNQWKILGIYTSMLAVLATIFFLITYFKQL